MFAFLTGSTSEELQQHRLSSPCVASPCSHLVFTLPVTWESALSFLFCKMDLALVPMPRAGVHTTHCLHYEPRKYEGLDCPHWTAGTKYLVQASQEERTDTASDFLQPPSKISRDCFFSKTTMSSQTCNLPQFSSLE